MENKTSLLSKCQDLIDKTIKSGATSSEVIMFAGNSLDINIREQKVETIERAESLGVGLRVFVGKKQAVVSSSDISESALTNIVEKAIAMAKLAPNDKFSRIATKDELCKAQVNVDICDAAIISEEALINAAMQTEAAALADKKITNSEGASAGTAFNSFFLANSHGFAKEFSGTNSSFSVSVIAGLGEQMQRDYDYSSKRYFSDLASPAKLGKSAASKTIAKLNPQKSPTGIFPVVFDKRVARSLLGNFASAINGANIARGTSFLNNSMGKPVFPNNINIINDPHIKRGAASKPFDAEALDNHKVNLVTEGFLQSWLLDIRSASQLNLKSNGCASRGLSSPPSPGSNNLYMQNGSLSFNELIQDIKSGFLVTETMGMGVNIVSGDYSQGASGFWIENGKIAYPVNEITIASNLLEMFESIVPANDLELEFAINSPSLLVSAMTIAGK